MLYIYLNLFYGNETETAGLGLVVTSLNIA